MTGRERRRRDRRIHAHRSSAAVWLFHADERLPVPAVAAQSKLSPETNAVLVDDGQRFHVAARHARHIPTSNATEGSAVAMTPIERARALLAAARQCRMRSCTVCPSRPTAEQIAQAIEDAEARGYDRGFDAGHRAGVTGEGERRA